MSRRHLTLAVVAIASLVVSACSSNSPTAPQNGLRTPAPISADGDTPVDSTGRAGWSDSNG